MLNSDLPRVGVVIPCFRVARQILGVIAGLGPEVTHIYVVDDACPEATADLVTAQCTDQRVRVLRHTQNQGVGAAVVSGYRAALADDCDCVVKIDGDGQMDPALIPAFIAPILAGEADYTKGNRFFQLEDLAAMPRIRLLGNAVLSFFSKFSSGYYRLFDPTNGYTAIGLTALQLLPLDKLARRYFFESDLLFRLGTIGAVVRDIPMRAIYGDEVSGLKVGRILLPFLLGHSRNLAKRIGYNYFLRDFSVASLELLLSLPLLLFGLWQGVSGWLHSMQTGQLASSGTVMLAALPIILGTQLLLSFLNYDFQNSPRMPLQKSLRERDV